MEVVGVNYIETKVPNVYGYAKKDGTTSYRIRRVNPRTGKGEIRTVTPPEGSRSGRKLESFLTAERDRFFKELDAGLNPCTARSTFKEYFELSYKPAFRKRDKTIADY